MLWLHPLEIAKKTAVRASQNHYWEGNRARQWECPEFSSEP